MAENFTSDFKEWNDHHPIYFSLGELDKKKLLELGENRSLYWGTLGPLIILYSVFILTGLFGNGLVSLSILQNGRMRTSRNLLILSLSLSDILLCLVTMPLMLVELLTVFWPYGDHNLVCKLSDFFTHLPMYVGGFTVIVMVTMDCFQKLETGNWKWLPIGAIWTSAIILAAPFFIWVELSVVPKAEIPEEFHSTSVSFCLSTSWDHAEWLYHRYIYILPAIQILLPGVLFVVEIISVWRHQRSILVAMVTFTFFLSWLPLNLLSLVVTFAEFFDHFDESDEYKSRALFVVCYGISMTSACVNPLLYWKMDEKFKEGFWKMWIIQKIFGTRWTPNDVKRMVRYQKQDAFC